MSMTEEEKIALAAYAKAIDDEIKMRLMVLVEAVNDGHMHPEQAHEIAIKYNFGILGEYRDVKLYRKAKHFKGESEEDKKRKWKEVE